MPINLYFVIASSAAMLGGVGLINTSLAVFALHLNYDQGSIGLISSFFYVGFFIGSFIVPFYLRRVGHIKCFAAAAGIHILFTLLMVLIQDIYFWYLCRTIMGISYIFFSTIVESWINESVTDNIRARSLGIYRFIELIMVGASLYAIPFYGSGAIQPFLICAILFALSLLPVSLIRLKQPSKPKNRTFDPIYLWRVSPFVLVGCIIIGITNAGFRSMAPIFVLKSGLSEFAVANFITAANIAGGIMQYPLGYLSDKYSRRGVILLASTIAMIGLLIMLLKTEFFIYFGIFLFGGCSFCMYYLMSAYLNDRADRGEYNLVAISMTFTWAVGGMLGPILVGYGMENFGPDAYIYIIAFAHLGLSLFSLYRMILRPDKNSV